MIFTGKLQEIRLILNKERSIVIISSHISRIINIKLCSNRKTSKSIYILRKYMMTRKYSMPFRPDGVYGWLPNSYFLRRKNHLCLSLNASRDTFLHQYVRYEIHRKRQIFTLDGSCVQTWHPKCKENMKILSINNKGLYSTEIFMVISEKISRFRTSVSS